MRRYVILIDGEMKGFHAADPDQEPVRIYSSMGTDLIWPRGYPFGDLLDPILGEEFLDTCEQLPDGSLRRTIWRLR